MQRINAVLAENLPLISSANPAKAPTSTLTSKTVNQQKQAKTKTSSPSPGSEITEKHIETLFIRFTSIYGYLWLNAYQNEQVLETAKKEWLESLSPFKVKFIKEALHLVKKQYEFPPSLPMFVNCCKDVEARYQRSTYKMDPVKRAAPEVVKQYITKMKSYLHKNYC